METERPRLLSSRPMDAAVMPLPSDDVTPPVTKTYFATGSGPPGVFPMLPETPFAGKRTRPGTACVESGSRQVPLEPAALPDIDAPGECSSGPHPAVANDPGQPALRCMAGGELVAVVGATRHHDAATVTRSPPVHGWRDKTLSGQDSVPARSRRPARPDMACSGRSTPDCGPELTGSSGPCGRARVPRRALPPRPEACPVAVPERPHQVGR